jgi:RNA polymerase sigma factor (sigma-70 family)
MRKRDTLTEHMFDGPAWIQKRNEIVENNLDWARGIAERIARRLPTWFCADDLMGQAEIALIRVADQYASYQRVPFRAFAIQRLRGACYDAIRRREYKERGHLSLDEPHFDNPVSREAVEGGPDPEQLALQADLGRIWQHVHTLPARQAEVIWLLYVAEMSGKQVAERMGMSEPWVSSTRAEALVMLRGKVGR